MVFEARRRPLRRRLGPRERKRDEMDERLDGGNLRAALGKKVLPCDLHFYTALASPGIVLITISTSSTKIWICAGKTSGAERVLRDIDKQGGRASALSNKGRMMTVEKQTSKCGHCSHSNVKWVDIVPFASSRPLSFTSTTMIFNAKFTLLAFVAAAVAQSSSSGGSESVTGSATGSAVPVPSGAAGISPCIIGCVQPAAQSVGCSLYAHFLVIHWI